MDPKGKGIVINDKEKESFVNEPKDDKPTDSGSGHRRKEGKKKKTRRIKEIIYYDDSDESTSSQKDDDNDYKKTVNSNFSFDYSRIQHSSNSHLLSIPLGKPPHFDGEDYGFWSHKMRSHLFSLHPSIWEIVENGMKFDSSDSPMLINEQIHRNAQATTVLLASLCREEYNKVSGLDNAKQIWDTLKISHEGNDITMLTKMELVEGELGRFAMIRGEEPTQTYNRLKTLINKIRSYGSTRWTDHDVVRLMLRSFTVLDPHLVNNIRENPRYTMMTPEEVLGKFVSGRMMIKEARYVDDALNGPLHEPQPIALKATRSKESLPSKVAQVEAAGLNDEEMALIIKRFKTALKGRKGQPSKAKTKGKRSCFKCGKLGHFIANCPENDSDQEQGKNGKRENKKVYKKAKGEAHLGKEWDSDCSSSDSDDEGLAATAFNKSALFPNEHHTCLMAREKKVITRNANTYDSSSDDESSEDEIDYSSLFKGLDRTKIAKINELIDALNEKDRTLEKQEDLLYEEHDKFVSAQNSLALEVKRNGILSCELSTCNETISSLKGEINVLTAKLEVASNSCVENITICTRCKDFDVNACSEHLVSISKLNDEVASLNAQLKTSKSEVDKIKFARDAYTVGRHPSIKDGLGFKREAKNLTSHKAPIFVKEKGKAPMANSAKRNHAFLYHDRRHARNAYNDSDSHVYDSHAMFASSSSYKHDRDMCRRNVVHMPRRNFAHVPRKVVNKPSTIYYACNAPFAICRKGKKVIARKLGAKCKGDKTCIWVPKEICTNLVGPNKSWVPKSQA
uniref:Opie3 gag protein n=1 Tax=Zea mays subsp. mexicana TaxID=4579 RepID=I6M4V4_ZEAMM|nr:Opie3 gag protein [Zea mays subsp. mexicana]